MLQRSLRISRVSRLTAVDAHFEAEVVDLVGQSRDAVGEARHVGHNVAIDATSHFRPAVVDYQSSLALAHSKTCWLRFRACSLFT